MVSVWRIGVKDEFSAGHALRNYNGKCENMHGHNFAVEVILESNTLDKQVEYVLDFTVLKLKLKEILAQFDHVVLNDLPYFSTHNPTSENIAQYIYRAMQQGIAGYPHVRVYQVLLSERGIQYACYMEIEES